MKALIPLFLVSLSLQGAVLRSPKDVSPLPSTNKAVMAISDPFVGLPPFPSAALPAPSGKTYSILLTWDQTNAEYVTNFTLGYTTNSVSASNHVFGQLFQSATNRLKASGLQLGTVYYFSVKNDLTNEWSNTLILPPPMTNVVTVSAYRQTSLTGQQSPVAAFPVVLTNPPGQGYYGVSISQTNNQAEFLKARVLE